MLKKLLLKLKTIFTKPAKPLRLYEDYIYGIQMYEGNPVIRVCFIRESLPDGNLTVFIPSTNQIEKMIWLNDYNNFVVESSIEDFKLYVTSKAISETVSQG